MIGFLYPPTRREAYQGKATEQTPLPPNHLGMWFNKGPISIQEFEMKTETKENIVFGVSLYIGALLSLLAQGFTLSLAIINAIKILVLFATGYYVAKCLHFGYNYIRTGSKL
jgi:hypothetical protein